MKRGEVTYIIREVLLPEVITIDYLFLCFYSMWNSLLIMFLCCALSKKFKMVHVVPAVYFHNKVVRQRESNWLRVI